MTLAEIIRKGHGRSHAWTVLRIFTEPDSSNWYTELWHYNTKMLTWNYNGSEIELLDSSIGRGSVSDQNGCNTAFKVLGLPYYYSRAGGARITGPSTCPAFLTLQGKGEVK